MMILWISPRECFECTYDVREEPEECDVILYAIWKPSDWDRCKSVDVRETENDIVKVNYELEVTHNT